MREAFSYLRQHLGDDIASANLVLDGTSVVLCRGDELIDLVAARPGRAQHRAARPASGRARRGHPRHRRRATAAGQLASAQAADGVWTQLRARPGFAHNSERQFAKLLDFYGIEWEYEPRTFMLESDRDGPAAQAFTPDFYLPAYDLYIEITTLNQKLVTKKNRKVRLPHEPATPTCNVKILVPARLPPPRRSVAHGHCEDHRRARRAAAS